MDATPLKAALGGERKFLSAKAVTRTRQKRPLARSVSMGWVGPIPAVCEADSKHGIPSSGEFRWGLGNVAGHPSERARRAESVTRQSTFMDQAKVSLAHSQIATLR